MLDKKELRRLARLHRLARQIAASLPAEIYSTHALRVDERTDRLLKWQHDGSLQPESASQRMKGRESNARRASQSVLKVFPSWPIAATTRPGHERLSA
jgi:hypothetical protein